MPCSPISDGREKFINNTKVITLSEAEPASGTNPPHSPYQPKPRWAAVLLGSGLALVIVIAYALVRIRNPLPKLDRSQWEAASAKWEKHGPASYLLHVEVGGRQPATYSVEVRNRIPHKAWRDQVELTRRRTFATWTIPGMFDTVNTDLEDHEHQTSGTPSKRRGRLVQSARWDEQYGIPLEYRCIELGTQTTFSWKIEHFEVLDEAQ